VVVMRVVDDQTVIRHRRATIGALRRDFPRWAFAYDEPTGRWVAAPGHQMLPVLRVLRHSKRVEAATATALRAHLEARP
jgi:hypothetical protein